MFAGAGELLNCTISENYADNGGGVFHEPGGTIVVRNSIVALNLVRAGATGADVFGDFESDGNNLIGNGSDSTGFANAIKNDQVGNKLNPIDPKIGTLKNNGGPTMTHALLAGSPAIDKGDNAGVPPTDQRGAGFPRRKDGNGDGTKVVDIGAFEK